MEAKVSCSASQLDALYLWRNPTYFELSNDNLVERLVGGRFESPQMTFGKEFEDMVSNGHGGTIMLNGYDHTTAIEMCRSYVKYKNCYVANPSTYNVDIGGGVVVRTRPDFASLDGLTAIDLKATEHYDPENPYSSWSAQYAGYKLAGVLDASFMIATRTGVRPELYRITSVSVEVDPSPGVATEELRQRLAEQVQDLVETAARFGITDKVFKLYSQEDIWSRR